MQPYLLSKKPTLVARRVRGEQLGGASWMEQSIPTVCERIL